MTNEIFIVFILLSCVCRLVGVPPTTNPKINGIQSAPVILPVFPNSTPHSGQVTGGTANIHHTIPHQYSPSRFNIQKDCHVSDRCSWKCISVALILLCIALISILIYFAGKRLTYSISIPLLIYLN